MFEMFIRRSLAYDNRLYNRNTVLQLGIETHPKELRVLFE